MTTTEKALSANSATSGGTLAGSGNRINKTTGNAIAAFIRGLSGNLPKSVYYNPETNRAMLVTHETVEDGLLRDWQNRLSEIMGADQVETSPASAPPEWGSGTPWQKITPGGEIIADPGLQDEPDTDEEPAAETAEHETEPDEHSDEPERVLLEQRHKEPLCKIEDQDDKGYTFILGPVLVPGKFDTQGDRITKEEIERCAHAYMEESQTPGLMHKFRIDPDAVRIVESYCTRAPLKIDKAEIPEGTWMMAMNVYDPKLRQDVLNGTFSAYSIGGTGVRSPASE